MSVSAHAPVLVIVIPLAVALLTPVIGRVFRPLAWWSVMAATLASFLLSVDLLARVLDSGRISYRLGNWEPPWGIEYAVDYLNGFVLVIVSFLALVVTIYAKRSVEKEIEEGRRHFFYAIYLLFITGIEGMTVTGDLFNLYVFIEISALAGYALVAMGKRRAALLASYNYLILGTIAATFIVLGIGYLYMATGTLNMADMRMRLPALYGSTAVRTAFAFFMVGLSLKLALFPLHIWLPNVYTHAPTAVSALMAATSAKVSAYVLMRVMFTVFTLGFDLDSIPFTKILLVLSSVAIIAGSVLAVAQTNIRRMLAYSSVGQVGYIVLGASLANTAGMTGGILHILNHALMKGALFLAAGAVIHMTGVEDIAGLKGMGRRMPVTMAIFTVGVLSMIGVPLTAGFVSKWYLAAGALSSGMWFVVPVILLSSLLGAVYLWRVVENAYFKEADAGAETREAPLGMTLPAALLAGLCVVFGVASHLPLRVAELAAKMLLGV
jgi:multicomponent Na+:H+ antiporter subunit D